MARASPELSPSVLRMLGRARPSWRGRLHRAAFVVSVPVGVALVAAADGRRATIVASIFALGVSAMFGISAVVHLRAWPPARYHRLIQLDHTAIFLCCATTATPVGVYGLEGSTRVLLLAGMWIGAAAGIVAEWLPFHPPRGLMNTLFLVLGWYPVLFVPPLWRGLSHSDFVLMAAGGLIYTVGAVIVGAQRPDPWPEVFGYHEVWHTLVVVAVTLHYGLVWRLVS
jgi:hemolysin III